MAVFYDPRTGNYMHADVDPRTGQIVPGSIRPLDLQQAGVLPVEPGPNYPALRRMLAGLPDRKSPDQIRRELAEMNPAAPQAPETFRPLAGLPTENRGNSVRLLPVPDPVGAFVTAKADTIVCTPPDNGRDAEVITVTYGVEPEGQAPGTLIGQSAQLFGLLTWGVGGAQYQTTFDWGGGGSFSVAASFLRLGVLYGTNSVTPTPLWFSASLAYGPTAKRSNPLRLTVNPLSAGGAGTIPGGTRTFDVPRFATSFMIAPPNSGAAVVLGLSVITNLAGRTLANYQYSDVTNIGQHQENQFLLPNNAGQVILTNNGAANITNGSLIWNLGL